MPAQGSFTPVPKSAAAGMSWPALPGPGAATRLAVLYQLEQSQWWTPEVLRAWQWRQLAALLGHAARSVPFYAKRLRAAGLDPARPLSPEAWARLPLLRREDIQEAGEALLSARLPAGHGKTGKVTTSGSTGKPVTVVKSGLEQLFWECVTLRDHLWRGRDLAGKLAVIRSVAPGRATYPKGSRSRVWSRATASVYPTGPAVLLSADTSIARQAEWLGRENPDYLLTLPTNLAYLAEHCIERGLAPPRLREVATLGGILRPQARALARRAWNVPVFDFYSAQEVGYLALQCPEHEHYHVQAETVFVEVLDARGRPCPPGATGRVVVTPLHNFAMPLIRYDIGDYAEAGEPCPCGRGLSVLVGIVGRARNMLTLPSGERISPSFVNDWFEGLPVAQFQVVQTAADHLDFRIVPRRPFSAAEEARVRDLVARRLGPSFRVSLSYRAEIPRGPGGKYEDFRSDLEPARGARLDR